MNEPASSSDERLPTDAPAAFAGALSPKFPQLQSLLSANPRLTNDDLLLYLLLAELYRWLTDHAAAATHDGPEAQAVIQLCSELFATTCEHDDLNAALASEIVDSFVTERANRR